MMAGSIIYTISATDADTGNAAKVSYSILEVSTAPGHRHPDTALLGGSAQWGLGGREGSLGSWDPPQQLLCPPVRTPWDTEEGSLWAEPGRRVGAEPPPLCGVPSTP